MNRGHISEPKHCFAVRFLVILLKETVESLRLMRTSFPIFQKSFSTGRLLTIYKKVRLKIIETWFTS